LLEETVAAGKSRGAALGPDWTNILPIRGSKEANLAPALISS